jgi:hypothetical protein
MAAEPEACRARAPREPGPNTIRHQVLKPDADGGDDGDKADQLLQQQVGT